MPSTSQADAQEEDFWNTPGVPARTLHFTGDLLTNEQLDISGVDHSMSSPLAHAPTLSRSAKHPKAMQFTARESLAPTSNLQEVDSSFEDSIVGDAPGTGDPDDAASEEDEDVTVMLKLSPPKQDFNDDSTSHTQPLPESESISMIMDSHTPGETKTKTRFKITTELENIVVCGPFSALCLTYAYSTLGQDLVIYGRHNHAWTFFIETSSREGDYVRFHISFI